MSLLIYGNAARSVTWYMKRHTQSFSTIKKQLPTFFHLCALAVLVGLWIFRAAHLLLDVEQRRQYFDFDCWSQRALERNKNLWRNRFYSEANDGEQYIASVKCQMFIAEHFSNCSFTACQLSRKMKCIYVLLFQLAFVRNHEEK